MSFLPEDYESPQGPSQYMHFQEGENRFRILSAPILGWEDWMDKKPVRYTMDNKPAAPIDASKPLKHFWAMIVWNYKEEQIQILEITQRTVQKALETLCKDPEWKEPYFYDIKVAKSGEGKDTKYVINPVPHKALSPNVMKAFSEKRCNLACMFTGADPFAMDNKTWTKGIFTQEDLKQVKEAPVSAQSTIPNKKITEQQALSMIEMLSDCSVEFQEQAKGILNKLKVSSWYDMDTIAYDNIFPIIQKKRDETKQFDIFGVA